MKERPPYNVDFRIWFYHKNEKFLGKGRVELLEKIKATGSISGAAAEMKMSYRQAWQMVKEMNERGTSIVVEKQLGGKSGGGATVTEAGDRAIKQFYQLQNKIKQFIEEESKKLKF